MAYHTLTCRLIRQTHIKSSSYLPAYLYHLIPIYRSIPMFISDIRSQTQTWQLNHPFWECPQSHQCPQSHLMWPGTDWRHECHGLATGGCWDVTLLSAEMDMPKKVSPTWTSEKKTSKICKWLEWKKARICMCKAILWNAKIAKSLLISPSWADMGREAGSSTVDTSRVQAGSGPVGSTFPQAMAVVCHGKIGGCPIFRQNHERCGVNWLKKTKYLQ